MRRVTVALLACLLASAAAATEGWTVYSTKGGVESSYKAIEGSKLLGAKGVAEVDVPIGRILGVFLDGTKSTEWVDMMAQYDERVLRPDVRVEYQLYDMPWPIWDREFVLERTDTFDATKKMVRITYKSVAHADFPEHPERVRGEDYGSFWEFTALPGGRTRIVIEVFIDPKGGLPAWLVNSIQRGWPRATVDALVARALKPDVQPHPRVASW